MNLCDAEIALGRAVMEAIEGSPEVARAARIVHDAGMHAHVDLRVMAHRGHPNSFKLRWTDGEFLRALRIAPIDDSDAKLPVPSFSGRFRALLSRVCGAFSAGDKTHG